MLFGPLSEDAIRKVDNATMRVLENTGIAVYEKQALGLLENAGARVDKSRSITRIPEKIVRDAIEQAPKRFKLAARDPSKSIELGTGVTYFTNSATGIRVLDQAAGRIRDSVLSDIPKFAAVADALHNISFYGPTVVAHDVKGNAHFLHELVAGIENTTKHVAHECHGTELSRMYMKIAQVVAGGEDELARNPVISSGGCPVSPLQFDRANTEAMLESARAGMPYDVMSMAMGGGTAPLTLAGELTVINAEVLAGLTICQLARSGCPIIYGSVASVMDMRTGILALGAPERAILNAGVVQMAHHYQVPSVVGGMSTDGKMPGDQTMFEKTMTGLPAVLAGSDIIFGPGVLSSATTYSPEQLVIDSEVAGALLRIQRGMQFDNDSLATEVIHSVGPGGGFMGTRHTLNHMRKDLWSSELIDRNIHDNWVKAGSKDMFAKAKERVEDILSKHRVKPLDKEQRKEIDEILKLAQLL